MKQEINYEDVIPVPDYGIGGKIEKIPSDKRIDTVLIPEICLRRRIKALARQICNDYAKEKELNTVIVLKGAFVFASDLGREIYKLGGPEIRYNFIRTVTYGKEIKNSEEHGRKVRIELKPEGIKGKDVLLIEDIVDQVFTLSAIKQYLFEEENVKSLRICTLLNKILKNPSHEVRKLKNEMTLDYIGFYVQDRWIAGYGIDAGEDFRELPFIITVKEEYYQK